MKITDLTRLFQRDNCFLIHGRRDNEHVFELHLPQSMLKATVMYPLHYSFGWGFRFGRNGEDSDVGLDLFAGKLTTMWLRARAPWLKRARANDPKDWRPRHTSLQIHPFNQCLLAWELDHADRSSSRHRKGYSGNVTLTTILGMKTGQATTLHDAVSAVQMPEGAYRCAARLERYISGYARWPGSWLPEKVTFTWHIEIPGGIPVPGKGENTWDLGMDGIFDFATGERSLQAALLQVTQAACDERSRYADGFKLPAPMTVAELRRSQYEPTTDMTGR